MSLNIKYRWMSTIVWHILNLLCHSVSSAFRKKRKDKEKDKDKEKETKEKKERKTKKKKEKEKVQTPNGTM